MRFMGYEIWVMGYGIWVMGYGIWVMGYGIWDRVKKIAHSSYLITHNQNHFWNTKNNSDDS